MPIHLLWGDNISAVEQAIESLIKRIIDPDWSSINLSRLDGSENSQALRALEEIRTPPFGNGGRIVLLKKSPFCNNCPTELATQLEESIKLIPERHTLF